MRIRLIRIVGVITGSAAIAAYANAAHAAGRFAGHFAGHF